MRAARSIRVWGVVQGVGFRPCVFRMARAHTLTGWVLNGEEGVEVHVEGTERSLEAFVRDLTEHPPPAASITAIDIARVAPLGLDDFTIRVSQRRDRPSTRISVDLPICKACLRELFEAGDRRRGYPYINCSHCGPRFTIVTSLPYDRPRTTMQAWAMCVRCAEEYGDPADRRFHAQPVACPACGPHYALELGTHLVRGDEAALRLSARLLEQGRIVAVKGLGGYHLACDAKNATAVLALRERKYRKERPFALMVKDLETARRIVELSEQGAALATSTSRPIVLAPAKAQLPGVAPDNHDFAVMLPYTAVHHLLFEYGAPDVLVMTSANRSSEPLAYEDNEARERLSGIADALLIGERPIARRMDDSVVRDGAFGPVILRRARGYAPSAAATLPIGRPLLAVGGDLKNTVTLVVDGQAFVSQHLGDLDHYGTFEAFRTTIRDLVSMYEVRWEDLLVAHDCHPEYVSTTHALALPGADKVAIQHHRAHLASVIAEKGAWGKRVVGVSFDGTGYGDDATVWGGEIFVGSAVDGFYRAAHLRPAVLPGGDAAARHPVQAAAGFLAQLDGLPNLRGHPFLFPARYRQALALVGRGVRVFRTTSVGRLFDTAAALLGFVRKITFEGQAAIWLEHLARVAPEVEPYPFPLVGNELDFGPLLREIINDRSGGRDPAEIARAFHHGIAKGLCDAVLTVASVHHLDTAVLSGGVFQNDLLLGLLKSLFDRSRLQVWTNCAVPPNDGGISLGQAALAAVGRVH